MHIHFYYAAPQYQHNITLLAVCMWAIQSGTKVYTESKLRLLIREGNISEYLMSA